MHEHNYQPQYFWVNGEKGEPTGDLECVDCELSSKQLSPQLKEMYKTFGRFIKQNNEMFERWKGLTK